MLNDITRWIARTRPADVDDPDDPSMADVIRHAGDALSETKTANPKASILSTLLTQGLNYQEAVTWYWYRYCDFTLSEIALAAQGLNMGGDPEKQKEYTADISDALRSAAAKLNTDINLDHES